MKRTTAVIVAATFAALVLPAIAQPPGGPGGPGGPGRPGGPDGRGGGASGSNNAVLAAVDADGDHEISAEEMKNAFAALKSLDLNKDGKLVRDEIHPEFGGRERSGPGGGPGGRERGGPGGGGPADAARFAERILAFDSNKDGKVSTDELPERMRVVLSRHDTDKDGALDKAEIDKLSQQSAATREGGRPGGPSAPGGRERGGPGGRGGRGGPPNPEEFVTHAMTFDADKDGLLSKAELSKFAEEFARRGPPGGGPGGPEGRGGFGGGRRGPGGGAGRPQRPARPE